MRQDRMAAQALPRYVDAKASGRGDPAITGRLMAEPAVFVIDFAGGELGMWIELRVITAVMAQQTRLIGLLERTASQESRIQIRCKLIALALHKRVVACRAYQPSPADGAAIVVGQRYRTGFIEREVARVATRDGGGLIVALSTHCVVVIVLDRRVLTVAVAGAAGHLIPMRKGARFRHRRRHAAHGDGQGEQALCRSGQLPARVQETPSIHAGSFQSKKDSDRGKSRPAFQRRNDG